MMRWLGRLSALLVFALMNVQAFWIFHIAHTRFPDSIIEFAALIGGGAVFALSAALVEMAWSDEEADERGARRSANKG